MNNELNTDAHLLQTTVIASTDLNRVHHADFLNNNLPDKCAKLIIADPPYYKVKGEFDFIWKTFEDYLKDVEKWAVECKRILADNGTLLWYGDAKKIAYSQIIFDKYFNLLSNVTCHIYDRQTNKIPADEARSFINTTERILMYSNEVDYTGLQEIQNDQTLYKQIRDYFVTERLKVNESLNLINKNAFGDKSGKDGMDGNILSAYKKGWSFPTLEKYNKLQKTYNICLRPYEELRKEYDGLRKEYEDLLRPFNPTEQYKMDVLRVSQEGHITGNYDHDTVKPEKLTRILIKTCSRENDLVIVPFAGSGTECAMSAKENRPFIGYEITKKHVDMSNKRVKKILDNPPLFAGL